MTRRASRGEHQSRHSRDVQIGHLRRHQVVGNQNTFTLDPRRRRPGERSRHLLSDRVHVDGTRPEVVIGDVRELGLDVGDGVSPGPGRRYARSDAGSNGVEEVRVVDEHEVGIEDPGFALTAFACGLGANPLDVPPHLGDGRTYPAPLASWSCGDSSGTSMSAARIKTAGPIATPGEAGIGVPGAGSAASDLGPRRGSDDVVLVEAPIGERDDVVESFTRLAARCGQLDPMTAQRAQCGDPREAGGRNRPRPVSRLRSSILASNRRASWTRRAAGRACNPWR